MGSLILHIRTGVRLLAVSHMTLPLEVSLPVIGLIAGFMGGLAAATSIHNQGFKRPPAKAAPKSPDVRKAQRDFFWSRALYGALIGFIVTFLCIDSVAKNSLSLGSLVFIQAMSGMSSTSVTSLVALAVGKLRNLLGAPSG